MRKTKIYASLVLTLLLLLSTLTPALASKKGDVKNLFPPSTAKGKGAIYVEDYKPPALDKGKAQGILNHRLYDPAAPGDEANDFPGCGNGVTTVDPVTGETVSIFPGKGDGVSTIGADGTIVYSFPARVGEIHGCPICVCK